MPVIPCLDCKQLFTRTTTSGTGRNKRAAGRCPRCATHYPKVTHAETQRRSRTVAAHRDRHGDWCPGWHRPAHPAPDLTADHIVPVGAGGREDGPLTVLCRSCNSKKQKNC